MIPDTSGARRGANPGTDFIAKRRSHVTHTAQKSGYRRFGHIKTENIEPCYGLTSFLFFSERFQGHSKMSGHIVREAFFMVWRVLLQNKLRRRPREMAADSFCRPLPAETRGSGQRGQTLAKPAI